MAGPGGFVGRSRELSRLQAALGGDTRLLLVVGDAGIGKTRLVAEGMRLAAAKGTVSLRGGCLPLAEKLPLLPIREALDELRRVEDGGRVLETAFAAAPPFVRSEVRRLLPQLGCGEGEAALRGRRGCGTGYPLPSPRCWRRWPGGGRSVWWSRMCTGPTARRWIC